MKIAADFSILESQKEFLCQYCQHREEKPWLPMLTSSCPDWDRYVEYVPTALHSSQSETVQIMEQSDLASNDTAVDTLFGDMKEKEVRLHEGASSNGYLAHIFRHMAKELLSEDMGVLTYCILRNKDFQEVTLESDEEVLLRFEAAFGFRNIQKWSRSCRGASSPATLWRSWPAPGMPKWQGQTQADDGCADRALLRQMEGIYLPSQCGPRRPAPMCRSCTRSGLGREGRLPLGQEALHTA
uniref:Uncharacterized protein n=1 Tax=Myotis myotis TaxID=51298 RepID=A0A7J7Z6Q8_MYOMY|nr:hypothetical protein mMyoMyo1_013677 [Myotis myotis]